MQITILAHCAADVPSLSARVPCFSITTLNALKGDLSCSSV